MSCFVRYRQDMQCKMATQASKSSPPSLFSDPEADIVIISSDEVRFRVHMHILANASPVFQGMFSVPLPSPSADEDDLAAVTLSEPGSVVEQLLCFSYPSLNGTVQGLSTLRQLFAAAEKYEMKGVTAQLGFILRHQFIEQEPQCAYALACIYDLPEEARLAAKQTLLHPHPGPMLPEYDEMPASMYYRLVVYRQKCMDVIHPLINDWAYKVCGLKDIGWTRCANCPRTHSNFMDEGYSYWFVDHLERTKAAYLARPRGTTVACRKLMRETMNKHFPSSANPAFGRHDELINGCQICRSQAPLRLIDFNEKLGVLLEKKISEISFLQK